MTPSPCYNGAPPRPPPHFPDSFAGLDDIANDAFDMASVSSGSVFIMQGNRLVLSAPLDYERRELYTLNVSVTDRLGVTGFTVSITAVVAVGDVNDITGSCLVGDPRALLDSPGRRWAGGWRGGGVDALC